MAFNFPATPVWCYVQQILTIAVYIVHTRPATKMDTSMDRFITGVGMKKQTQTRARARARTHTHTHTNARTHIHTHTQIARGLDSLLKLTIEMGTSTDRIMFKVGGKRTEHQEIRQMIQLWMEFGHLNKHKHGVTIKVGGKRIDQARAEWFVDWPVWSVTDRFVCLSHCLFRQ